MGSPVQERGDSERSPDGQLRDQNGGKGDSPAIPDGWAWSALGEWAQSGPQTQPHVSVSPNVTGDLGCHSLPGWR